ncbi:MULTISPECIES: CopY/TcrY family copper transport repressor [Lactobacillus]|uniref:CopY/TcrY family copper transport repressor n=1 Tax=Lactobacillus xujianguonis TaxID=2495899 RepID=A0A437SX44_9LACO|nr:MULTISPECIES: CopY/TcrY family copper transport repressor [Lactobacillus]RVU71472.1 CopY/TcrY family copper transport repressor [Lactobacillus xujianguonis]RVU73695.1 CopY/TcrY family copper transport repressor [Lactobacillus xujianguonis]
MTKTLAPEKNISDSEWDVMRIVWTLKQTSSTKIIEELQAKHAWSESTIKTLIRRLVQKGCLQTHKDGRRFLYSATVSQTEMMIAAAQELLDRMCDMHKGEVILKLLADSPISQADLSKMAKVITKKQKTAPAMVPCNCLPGEEKMCMR